MRTCHEHVNHFFSTRPNLTIFFLISGANILRGVAGAGVLAGFDKFSAVYLAWRLGN